LNVSPINLRLKSQLAKDIENFVGGNIKCHLSKWKILTNNDFILDIVANGLKLDFHKYPHQQQYPRLSYSDSETAIIKLEIAKLLKKKVIAPTIHPIQGFVSTIFTRDKKDGTKRMILNLKKLNEYINYNHFKMESIDTALQLLRPGVYLASIDLKDAFYSIPICSEHQSYLTLIFETGFYKFLALPNGYGPAMRIFTKITKVPFSFLREQGFLSVVYVDDSLLIGDTYEECVDNIRETVTLLRELGFTIHLDKSVLQPQQKIKFLGFDINTIDMTLTLPITKKEAIYSICTLFLNKLFVAIRELAKLIGMLVATFPAVPMAPFYYRSLEKDKIRGLKFSKGNFDGTVKISDSSKSDLLWWVNNVYSSKRIITTPSIDMTIYTDASLSGWGINDGYVPSGGPWKEEYKDKHINVLELIAIKFGVLAYCKYTSPKHIRIMTDSTTAIAYINKKGGIKSKDCNQIAKDIWEWCYNKNIFISAAHVPGVCNDIADFKSRVFEDATEWQLNPYIFKNICLQFGTPDIDIFASYANSQLEKYVSWQPDPFAFAIDAFSMSWDTSLLYMFPPFSLISKVLFKIWEDKAEAVLVVPKWSSQIWYPIAMKMCRAPPVIVTPSPTNLLLTHKPTETHPLHGNLHLAILRVSGKKFQKIQETF